MKKKFLIISASISLLLACFPFTLSAEEVPQNDAGISAPAQGPFLDSYFYENYDLLPYLESTGTQYINTSINASSDMRIDFKVSDLKGSTGWKYLTGVRETNANYALSYNLSSSQNAFWFYNSSGSESFLFEKYTIYNFTMDHNKVYINNVLVKERPDNSFESTSPIYIFATNIAPNGSDINSGGFKLYSYSIYDYDTEDYLRYYYPAKAKSSGTMGLYDAVSKTFVTSSGNAVFTDPDNDHVMNFQIGTFITAGLGWIGDILDYAISEPVILLFMAIGLAGATFRWARRLVHF